MAATYRTHLSSPAENNGRSKTASRGAPRGHRLRQAAARQTIDAARTEQWLARRDRSRDSLWGSRAQLTSNGIRNRSRATKNQRLVNKASLSRRAAAAQDNGPAKDAHAAGMFDCSSIREYTCLVAVHFGQNHETYISVYNEALSFKFLPVVRYIYILHVD